MSRELWEIVRVDQLNQGDTFRYGVFTEPHVIESIHKNRVAVHVNETHRLASVATVFRRISDADDPRVLRRALEFAVNEIEARDRYGTSPNPKEKDFIDQARRELESEGSDAT